MINHTKIKNTLLSACACLALAACGDSSTEIASPGDSGPNPGTGSGGSGGGSGSGGGGGSSAGNCPTGTTEISVGSATHCELEGTIATNITLTSDNIYLLDGPVFVGEEAAKDGTGGTSATLTIEPGTTVYGKEGSSGTADSVLIVTRGSRLVADGTASDPIIFTSAQDLGVAAEFGATQRASFSGSVTEDPNTSEWGGLVINGLATINSCNEAEVCEADGEGDSGKFGGNDDTDDSGVLNYVQVKYAGNVITSDDELNGIAFQGVGSGTVIDYLQVHNGADDGVEFFGGTAEAKHLVITGADDDSLDWTMGWRGKVQHLLIVQNPLQPASDQGIEADNFGPGNDFLPRANPTIANATIIGGVAADPDAESDIGILLREGTAAQIYNTVVTGFGDTCIDVDDSATWAQVTGDVITVASTLLGCENAAKEDDEGPDFTDPVDLSDEFLTGDNNVIGDTSLTFFVNGPAEAAIVATDVNAIDTFFDATSYVGAVENSDSNWTSGWTFGLNPDPTCPSTTTATSDGTGCVLEGTITSNTRLVAGLDYFLRGPVFVGEDVGGDAANPSSTANSANLTIDAGVTIQAETSTSALFVSRGSKILSNGTEGAPVTMTAINDDTRNLESDTALWGGLVINGRATINSCNGAGDFCEADGEGDSGKFGGNSDTDDSGHLFYTVVKYAGNIITSDDELNGIAFQGVGSGTDIDYLQVHNGADDGVEFFGGTVNAKHLVITGADDDSLDWTMGWRGNVQHLLIIQNPNQPSTDQGIEADNFGSGNDFLPRANPTISNATIIGGVALNSSAESDIGILLREGTAASIYNSVVMGFGDVCLDVDDSATWTQYTSGAIKLESILLACDTATKEGDEAPGFTDPVDLSDDFAGKSNNSIGTSTLAAPTDGGKAYVNGANEAAITVTDVNAINSFFAVVDYVGAVKDNAMNWAKGWTVWIND